MSPPDSSTHPAMKTWFHGDMVLLSLRLSAEYVDLGATPLLRTLGQTTCLGTFHLFDFSRSFSGVRCLIIQAKFIIIHPRWI
jgi:hypothetical protein